MPIVTDLDNGKEVTKRDALGMNQAQNYQDKIVRVANTGESEAWVRIFVAVPAALENITNPSDSVLHWDVGDHFDASKNGKYNSSTAGNPFTAEFGDKEFVSKQTIGTTEYNIYSFTRKTALKAGETTAAVMVGLYLDESVDYNSVDGYNYLGSKRDPDNRITVKGVGEMKDSTTYYDAYSFENGVMIPVYAEAVQVAGFATSDEAFGRAIEAGHEAPHEAPYDPWTAGNAEIEVPDAIKNVDEFVAALDNLSASTGDFRIVLTPNKVYDFKGVSFSNGRIAKANSITIEGNNAVIINLSQPLIAYSYNPKSVTIKDLTIRNADMTNLETYNAATEANTRAQSYGAFIQTVTANVESVTLSNCHLENSIITSTLEGSSYNGSLVGGLIGYCQLKNSNAKLTVSNCSVEGSAITGRNVVGGIIGNLVNGQMTISNTEVKNCTIASTTTTRWGVGTIVGSNNNSTITATGFDSSGNTLKEDNYTGSKPALTGYRDTYGLKVDGSDLTVNGTQLF